MNEECPNIEPAPLPEPPRRDGNFSTVGDFMKTVKQPETAVDVSVFNISFVYFNNLGCYKRVAK